MTSDRAAAYGRVVRLLADMGPTRLLPGEQDRVRGVIDTLVLAPEPDPVTRAALEDLDELLHRLLEADRWELAETDRLLAEVRGCAPAAELASLQ